jgi:hypothetical protein
MSARLQRLAQLRARPPASPPSDSIVAAELEAIRERVRRNEPRHGDPEAFHVEKSAITGRLTAIIESLRSGLPLRIITDVKG